MVAIVEDTFCHTPDRASFIEGTINVVYQNGSGQWLGGQLMPLNKCDIHEESSGPTIKKSLDLLCMLRIHSLYLYLKREGDSQRGGGHCILAWKMTFRAWNVHLGRGRSFGRRRRKRG